MECRIVRFGQRHNIAKNHPELATARPDLVTPAFPENPVSSDDDFPYLFYFIENGEIVGVRKAIPDLVWRGSETFPFAWCFDTYVNPEHHGKGIGTKLVAVQVEEFERRGDISAAAFSAPAMMRIYEKLGYDVLGCVPKYARLRNTAPFLARKISSNFAVSLLAPFVNAGLAVWLRLRSDEGNRNIKVRKVSHETFRILSKGFERDNYLYWDQEADWTINRLQQSDTLYSVHEKSAETPSVILVARLRDQLGKGASLPIKRLTIVHFIIDEDVADSFSHLAQAANLLLRQTKADVVDIVTSSPDLQKVLQDRGFSRRGEGMTYVFKAPTCLPLPNADQQSDWHLTHYCSDGFLFD